MARPKPRSVLRVPGTNNYTLEIHEFDEGAATAVITGTFTGKRHANVALTRDNVADLHAYLGAMLAGQW